MQKIIVRLSILVFLMFVETYFSFSPSSLKEHTLSRTMRIVTFSNEIAAVFTLLIAHFHFSSTNSLLMPRYSEVRGYVSWIRTFTNLSFRHSTGTEFIAARWLREGTEPSPLKVFEQITWEGDVGKGVTLNNSEVARYISIISKVVKRYKKLSQKRIPKAYHECTQIIKFASHYHNVDKGSYVQLLRIASSIEGKTAIVRIMEILDQMQCDSSVPAIDDYVLAQAITSIAKTHTVTDKLIHVELLLSKYANDIDVTVDVLQAYHSVVAFEKGFKALQLQHKTIPSTYPKLSLGWRYYYIVGWHITQSSDRRQWLLHAESMGIQFPPSCFDIWISCTTNHITIMMYLKQADHHNLLSGESISKALLSLNIINSPAADKSTIAIFELYRDKYKLHNHTEVVILFLKAVSKMKVVDEVLLKTIKEVVVGDLLKNSEVQNLQMSIFEEEN